MSFVTFLESTVDDTRLPPDRVHSTHGGRPLLVRYDLEAVRGEVDRDELGARPDTPWRFRELLPLEHEPVSLGERSTPLLECPRLGAELGLDRLLVKDESTLPTGSFKARGLAMAVSRARELGLTRLAVPSAGNAGGALAAYAARAGLEAWVLVPVDAPLVNRREAALLGAHVVLVEGLITDCGALVQQGAECLGWFDCSTLKEPYRLEGKKTMGLEIAQQLGWRAPSAVAYPTGGGTGLIGTWKAYEELSQLGWLEEEGRPRLFACQSTGCDPIVRAYRAGERHAEAVDDPVTAASGLRVPRAVGDALILDAVRQSGGQARAADEERLLPWMRRAARLEGISFCPESAACLVVLEDLVREGLLAREEPVVLFNTGAAQKSVEALDVELPVVDPRGAVDWDELARSSAPR